MSVKRKIAIVFALVLIPSFASGYDLGREVSEMKLANGMKWLVVTRKQAPVFSGAVAVRVGGIDEEPGKTGLAHVFEHMAFKGSSRLGTKDWAKEKPLLDEIERTGLALTQENRKESPDPALVAELSKKLAELEREADKFRAKNEIWEIMSRNGAADMNAYTSKDITNYHASLPSNRFELFANVFSEMVFKPAFREFFPERSVIAQERRSGVDNDPDGLMSERILAASYDGGPFSWPTIGSASDVMGLTIEDARRFHARHYVPGNMVGVIVGDITAAQARPVLEKTFGRFPAGPKPPTPAKEASARAGAVERFPFEAEPSVAFSWIKPTLPDPSEYSFDLIKALLCDGRSSRLKKRLVYEKKLADDVYCSKGYPGARMENLFLIWIDPMKSVSPKRIAEEVADELKRLREEPVGEEELASVKKRFNSSFIFNLDDNIDLAASLAEFQATYGDWRLLADYPAMISGVTPQQIMQTAMRYLTDERRVTIERFRGKR